MYLLNISENLGFSDIFRGYRRHVERGQRHKLSLSGVTICFEQVYVKRKQINLMLL